jgi:hypothetical protein
MQRTKRAFAGATRAPDGPAARLAEAFSEKKTIAAS